MRLTFRQWSILADMGEQGREILAAYRDMRRTRELLYQSVLEQSFADALRTGTGVMMMDQNRPRRIDPSLFLRPLTRPASTS